jgi:hypothetical protein
MRFGCSVVWTFHHSPTFKTLAAGEGIGDAVALVPPKFNFGSEQERKRYPKRRL